MLNQPNKKLLTAAMAAVCSFAAVSQESKGATLNATGIVTSANSAAYNGKINIGDQWTLSCVYNLNTPVGGAAAGMVFYEQPNTTITLSTTSGYSEAFIGKVSTLTYNAPLPGMLPPLTTDGVYFRFDNNSQSSANPNSQVNFQCDGPETVFNSYKPSDIFSLQRIFGAGDFSNRFNFSLGTYEKTSDGYGPGFVPMASGNLSSLSVTDIPEPTSVALLAIGGILIGNRRRGPSIAV